MTELSKKVGADHVTPNGAEFNLKTCNTKVGKKTHEEEKRDLTTIAGGGLVYDRGKGTGTTSINGDDTIKPVGTEMSDNLSLFSTVANIIVGIGLEPIWYVATMNEEDYSKPAAALRCNTLPALPNDLTSTSGAL